MQHWLPVRVYYEDTDFTGMVYHANYLRFFERGRSEFLRDAGVSHQSLLALPEPAAFTLTNVQVDYKRAARIDDALMICSRYTGVTGAKVLFEQTARRTALCRIYILVEVRLGSGRSFPCVCC